MKTFTTQRTLRAGVQKESDVFVLYVGQEEITKGDYKWTPVAWATTEDEINKKFDDLIARF